ncbi:hypothetical protein [Promicromonospora sp. AC04]|uniref:hypothetical protein n=1 Tax=Promicromonospora sp. AC04 TaxID=2135723 RepID=UPI0011B1C8F5|nr:hypothetical protein [Promicromonospora sp. AC04]
MEIREERQLNPVADEVSGLVAVTRPIIVGLLHSIGEEYLEPHGGRENMRLADLGRVRKASDGDLGVAFEYAIHDAVMRQEEVITDRVATALKKVKITQGDPASILFAIEKTGAKQLVETKRELITPESRALSGKRGQPVKLQGYLNQLAAAFHRPTSRVQLPRSIRGLWKADLFLGSAEPDRWVGASVKINRLQLDGAEGLRIGIVPTSSGKSDAVRLDESRNLVVCPVPHDFSFMQVFYTGMRIVQALVASDFKMPSDALLPEPAHREVARIYVERRNFKIGEVLDAVSTFAQPSLLETTAENVTATLYEGSRPSETFTALGPIPRTDLA